MFRLGKKFFIETPPLPRGKFFCQGTPPQSPLSPPPRPPRNSKKLLWLRGGRYASCVHAGGLSCDTTEYTRSVTGRDVFNVLLRKTRGMSAKLIKTVIAEKDNWKMFYISLIMKKNFFWQIGANFEEPSSNSKFWIKLNGKKHKRLVFLVKYLFCTYSMYMLCNNLRTARII